MNGKLVNGQLFGNLGKHLHVGFGDRAENLFNKLGVFIKGDAAVFFAHEFTENIKTAENFGFDEYALILKRLCFHDLIVGNTASIVFKHMLDLQPIVHRFHRVIFGKRNGRGFFVHTDTSAVMVDTDVMSRGIFDHDLLRAVDGIKLAKLIIRNVIKSEAAHFDHILRCALRAPFVRKTDDGTEKLGKHRAFGMVVCHEINVLSVCPFHNENTPKCIVLFPKKLLKSFSPFCRVL